MKRVIPALALAALFALSSCGGGGGGGGGGQTPGIPANTQVNTVATGLSVVWAMKFLPDGSLLLTERPGRVRIISPAGVLNPTPVLTVPDVYTDLAEGGLLGLAVHPDFANNHYVYLDYTDSATTEKVVRYTFASNALTNPTVILSGIAASNVHDGGRIEFGPDGKLYVTTGDATDRASAQDLSSLNGKILRLNDDGTVPADNPFVGTAGARGEIYSYGHRNSQGIGWDPNSGTMWESEHGPSGFDGPEGYDKINVITAGSNYGWPTYYGSQSGPGTVAPKYVFVLPVAPANLVFYDADLMPQFKGDIFVGALKGSGVLHLKVSGASFVSQEEILYSYGRIRSLAQAPDGSLYFATSNLDGRGTPRSGDDKILRLSEAP